MIGKKSIKNKILPLVHESWRKDFSIIIDNNIGDFNKLFATLIISKRRKIKVFPEFNNIFRAFKETPKDDLKVCIIGQDPYPKERQATGLAFAVNKDVIIPPSLDTIFEEASLRGGEYLGYDIAIGYKDERERELVHWAKQGVLLLNSSLTVQEKLPNSHASLWVNIIQSIINLFPKDIVIMAWGKRANSFSFNSDNILRAKHPVVHSYGSDGFLECRHFYKCNKILKNIGKEEINWSWQ